jgi:hypothetical protein
MKLISTGAHGKTIAVPYLLNSGLYQDSDARSAAFSFQHGHNLARGTVTEELSQSFLVKGNAVFLYQGDEIRRGVAGQG